MSFQLNCKSVRFVLQNEYVAPILLLGTCGLNLQSIPRLFNLVWISAWFHVFRALITSNSAPLKLLSLSLYITRGGYQSWNWQRQPYWYWWTTRYQRNCKKYYIAKETEDGEEITVGTAVVQKDFPGRIKGCFVLWSNCNPINNPPTQINSSSTNGFKRNSFPLLAAYILTSAP